MPTKRPLAVIITALPIEREAVVAHLHSVSEEPALNGSIYRRGIFDERSEPWDVIVAEIGAGNVGASAEAVRVIAHYEPEVALFVGIAGGIKDVKHGHVVASTKVYGYDSGKDEKGGLKTRPNLELASYALEQRARLEAGEPDWRQRIKSSGATMKDDFPKAMVAPIAAGEKVVASNRSRTYKLIRKYYNDAVAVEMEGYGFLLGVHMNHPTQGIVVRGISDLVEDKDEANDIQWQPIAAHHAAAFAFQILAKLGGSSADNRSKLAAQFDPAWQEKHLQEAQATAGPRYSPELRVGTPLRDTFEALGQTAEWQASVRARSRKLSKLIKRFLECSATTDDGGWGAVFPEHLREKGRTSANTVQEVCRLFSAIAEGDNSRTLATVATMIAVTLPQLRELQTELRCDLVKQHGDGAADSAAFRQFHAEYQSSFPATNLDATRDLIAGLEEFATWCHSGPCRASGNAGILLLGNAGVGKTHGICDIARDRFQRGLYTLVLFGEQFSATDEPWERIRQLLGLEPISRENVLQALDEVGAASGHPLLLCIDGLNESRPRTYWRNWLASLAVQMSRYQNLRLCVSCRSTYEAIALPEQHSLERIEHVGFSGMEFSACQHFFKHYGLEPPVAPSFHPEFANPLFLRLACETLRAAGVPRMPSGWHGLSTALRAFLRAKNKSFAQDYERGERERVPELALRAFIAEAERRKQVYLRWSEATAVIGTVQPSGLVGPTVLDWLVRAGLLIADADPNDDTPDAEDVVRIAFERLGDHLLAARFLSNIKPSELRAAIQSGVLNFAFSNASAVIENSGLVEALSIQLPEHSDFAVELVDVLPDGSLREAVIRTTLAAIPWRDPEYMTRRTQELLLEGLAISGYCHEVFDYILTVAAQETAPDAYWLHGLLLKQSMVSRDQFLCGYLHQRVGTSSAVERLLQAPFEVHSSAIPEPVCVRWAVLLLWFCVAADRRVRDRATKGLVAITQAQPKVWVRLVNEFATCNDEYVVERCFCAAYGALLRSRNLDAEREVALATYEVVFVDTSRFQHAAIRDYARCIIELAHHDGVLPATIKTNRVRSPYRSDWPLRIPTEKEVEPYAGANREYPKLYTSCLNDDFLHYTLSELEPYEHAVKVKEMARWVLNHVISDIGYGGEAIASYDRYMLYTHGGGRGRPKWAERIGKKYQLIALNRLAARLADHVQPKSDRDWYPKVRGVPLVYARGRDIDPSLLARQGTERHEGPVWWFPAGYDFAAVAGQTNAEWTTTSQDVPSSETLLQPITRADGEWQLLEGYPTWSARAEDEEGRFTSYRQVWTQVRGYFVKQKDTARVFTWLSKQDFNGRWMPEGAYFHEGYVGEYPWGILYTMYPDSWHSRGGGGKKPPVRLVPVCNSVSASYEEDAYQNDGITIHVPAREFFEPEKQLRWDGLGGYQDEHGSRRFFDPSLDEAGSSALLVDRSYLLDFLRRNELAIVWSVLGEKIFIGGSAEESPRLEFSRAHVMDASGVLRSSTLRVSSS